MIKNKDACYLVGLWGNEVVASCGLRNIVGEGEITNVVTKFSARSKGIGKQMLLKLLEEGSAMGVEAFTLEVRKSPGRMYLSVTISRPAPMERRWN